MTKISKPETEQLITKKELNQVFWRSFQMEFSWNYERQMNMAYVYAMIPILKKLYPKKAAMAAALKRHLVFFNTTPHIVTFILGINAAMEEENILDENFEVGTIDSIKTSLMGPLAGLGDSFFWGTLRLIATGVGTSLALQGNPLGPILFLLIFNIPHVMLRYLFTRWGYRLGTGFLKKIQANGMMASLTLGASIIGLMVVGTMTASMIDLTIAAIAKVKEQTTVKTIAMTSDPASPITEVVDEVIDLQIGIETVGFVTKGYSATVLQLMLLGLKFAYQHAALTEAAVTQELAMLSQAVANINSVITKTAAFWGKHQKELTAATRFIAIGYGPNVGTAKEFETKFTETVRLPAQGFEVEAYMHGPYLEANQTHTLFFIENQGAVQKRSQALKDYMSQYVGACFTITTQCDQRNQALSIATQLPEKISPLLLVIPFQYLAYQVALAKGIDLSQRIFDDFDRVLKSKLSDKGANKHAEI